MKPFALFRAAALALLLAPAFSALGLAASPPAPAQNNPAQHQSQQSDGVTQLGGAQGWDAYSNAEKGRKVCYVVGKPSKSEPSGAKRDAISLTITHRPNEKVSNEVSFTAGYVFKEGSDAELQVDGKKFSLFTNKDGAWARDPATDKAIVDALAKGKQVLVKGMSSRGTATADAFALAGFAAALAQIDKACGVKR